MNPSDCPLYDKCHYVQKWGDKMCPQDDCGKYGQYISYLQGAREFAEWLPQHFDLRFSNNPDVWLDEFFNHTTDKVLAEWRKGAENG